MRTSPSTTPAVAREITDSVANRTARVTEWILRCTPAQFGGGLGHRLGDGMAPKQGHHSGLTVSLICALVLIGGGCSDPAPTPTPTATTTPSPTPTASRTPTGDPAVAEAEAAVLEAYRGYWDGLVTSYADPSQPQSPALAANSDDTALTDAQAALIQLQSNGIHIVGEPVLTPSVTSIDLGSAPTATIVDCVDASNWLPVFTSSGESAAAPGQSTRLTYEATAFHPEDRWLIRTVTVHRDQPC